MSSRSSFVASTSQCRRVASAVAGVAVLGTALAAGTLVSAGPAAATAPLAQSVGRFLDGAGGGQPIESVVDVKDARATNPGNVSDQNPLDVELFNQADIPLTGQLQGPSVLGIHLGAANQVAVAKSDGYAYGAAGAVANSGGASLGGNNSAHPADASIRLDGSSLGSSPVPVPGGGSAQTLGGVVAHIGAVSALASTPAGFHQPGTTQYQIAGLQLRAGSPLLGQTLTQIAQQLNHALDQATAPLAKTLKTLPLVTLPPQCSLTTPGVRNVSFEGGAIRIENSTLHVNVAKLLREAGIHLNNLAPNTDLSQLLAKYLASGLGKGIERAVLGLSQPLQKKFTACADALNKLPGVGPLTSQLTKQLKSGQQQVTDAFNQIFAQLSGAGGSDPFKPLADGLNQLLDIGVNVQPNGPSGTFTSALQATPDQATPVVAGQTIVRALELKFGGGQLDLALANAAAGPSSPTSPPSVIATHVPTHHHHHHQAVPTAVPAGQGPRDTMPELPLVLVALGLGIGGLGLLTARVRGSRQH